MTAKSRTLSQYLRWGRRQLWRKQQRLAPRTRERMVIAALLLLGAAYVWMLLREAPPMYLPNLEIPNFKFK